MKRSRQKKNEVISSLAGSKSRQEKQKKRQKTAPQICVFDWLPDEMVVKILTRLPWQLDGIVRAVDSRWRDCIQKRWVLKSSLSWQREYCELIPCVKWVIKTGHIHLMQWFVSMKVGMYHKAGKYWMRQACRSGNAKIIAWLASQKAPEYVRWKPGEYDVSTTAQWADLACFRMIMKLSGRRAPWNSDVYATCRGGQWRTTQWIMRFYAAGNQPKAGYEPNFGTCVQGACNGDHADMMNWLLTHGKEEAGFIPGTVDACNYIHEIVYGRPFDVAMLEYMWNHSIGKGRLELNMSEAMLEPRDFLMSLAVGIEWLPALDWLWEHGLVVQQMPLLAPTLKSVRIHVVENHIKILRWLHYHNCVNLSKARVYGNGQVILIPGPDLLEDSCLLISSAGCSAWNK